MKFFAFLILVAVALCLSILVFADTATFEFFARWIVVFLAFCAWLCLGIWLFIKVEM